MSELSIKSKKEYIKRHVDNDVVDLETYKTIFKIIMSNNGESSIRKTKETEDGIFVNLDKLNNHTIDSIYIIINKRIKSIVMK